jgi:hypothetical protein
MAIPLDEMFEGGLRCLDFAPQAAIGWAARIGPPGRA